MKKNRYFTIIISLLFISSSSFAQPDSSKLKISIITCSPGGELYATFGHTAIRVIDSIAQTDSIYNYGTFDFEDPGFYQKFVLGKLDYFLSTEATYSFLYSYAQENRSVWEQDLLLTAQEKKSIQQFLVSNLQGNKKYYKYDFLFDNCTSRVRDILSTHAKASFTKTVVPPNKTFRNLIHVYLDSAGMCWSKLGIDVLLGSKIDRAANPNETNFLPQVLLQNLTNQPSIIAPTLTLYNAWPNQTSNNKYLPSLFFGFFFFILMGLTFSKQNWATIGYKVLSSFLLYANGLMGVLLLFMWFATNHQSCANNYNLLWALPTNFIAAFFMFSKKRWVKKYFSLTFILSIATLLLWGFLPQQLNVNLVPIIASLAFVYYKFK
jgi:hypothetical protein